jgi:hypothetical protein
MKKLNGNSLFKGGNYFPAIVADVRIPRKPRPCCQFCPVVGKICRFVSLTALAIAIIQ